MKLKQIFCNHIFVKLYYGKTAKELCDLSKEQLFHLSISNIRFQTGLKCIMCDKIKDDANSLLRLK